MNFYECVNSQYDRWEMSTYDEYTESVECMFAPIEIHIPKSFSHRTGKTEYHTPYIVWQSGNSKTFPEIITSLKQADNLLSGINRIIRENQK